MRTRRGARARTKTLSSRLKRSFGRLLPFSQKVIEPAWLSTETVIDINKRVVSWTGEPFFLRDQGLLETALDKPKNHFHYGNVEDVASLATTLLLGIAQNHPFEHGNKRTGFLSAI